MFTMSNIYINFNMNLLTKFISRSRSTEFKNTLSREHLSSDHEDHFNQHENSHQLCHETGHSLLSLTKIQWKLKLEHD